jgi:hypothetical protein
VRHHKLAAATIAVALALDVALGLAYAAVTPGLPWWHGLYCALANAVTDGGDVTPANGAGYAIQAAEFVLVVPLFAATFSFFTSGLAAVHVRESEERVKSHVEARLRHHLQRRP